MGLPIIDDNVIDGHGIGGRVSYYKHLFSASCDSGIEQRALQHDKMVF